MSGYDFLRENAESFWRNAKQLFEQGEYNLAAFNIEQAFQLMLKYFLAIKIGDFPRTHSLRRLFREAESLCSSLGSFFVNNINVIGNIESAYIASRYYPIKFEAIEVKEMLGVFEKFLEVLDECL